MKYLVILSVFIGISLIPAVYAIEKNYIVMPFAEIEPIIDGKFTFESEWSDAKLTKFQSNGHDFYLQSKQDENFVYLFFDGVDFQTDPADNSISVRYQSLICFDVNADKGDKKQPDDFCLIQTVHNEFGEWVKTENAESNYTQDGESADKSMKHDYEAMWAFGNENDKFEKINHLSYEFKIPKESVMSKDRFGLNFRMYFGSASDDLVQLYDGVIWPPESDKDKPSTWGTLSMTKPIPSPLKQLKSGVPISEIECKETLFLIKKHDGTPICVTPETREKLKERGWDSPILISVIRKVPTVYLEPVDISSANNQFAIAFYSNLTQNDSTSNVFFSPASISTAFSILYEGARQNTSQEIQQVFGFPEEDNLRHSGYLSLHQSINKKSNTDTEISIANALWLAENFEPLAEYIDTATTFYDSTVSTVDFVSDEGVEKINKWVDDKTQGKITDILKPGSTDSNTKMAITNAIYFKGLWEYPFDPEDTYESEFMIDKDNSVNVQMMTFPHKMQVNYTLTEKMEMIELPYRNGTVSLLIILPNEIGDLRAVEESITVDNLKMWQDFPTLNRGINIHIPKFTLETEYDLTQQLPDMGMPTVFNPVHADLSGITGYKSLYVSQAIHKAFVEVNEKGTEAAGATVIVTDESGGQPFRADHPFVFIIQDNETDNILFMGRVVNPLQ